VQKIKTPDETVDVDFVAQLDADPIELKAPEAVLADDLTGGRVRGVKPRRRSAQR
jgi:hypothetical protein